MTHTTTHTLHTVVATLTVVSTLGTDCDVVLVVAFDRLAFESGGIEYSVMLIYVACQTFETIHTGLTVVSTLRTYRSVILVISMDRYYAKEFRSIVVQNYSH